MLNHDLFEKQPLMSQNLKRLFGTENIVFSEGNEWKKSRKIISNSFNFEFLMESIPIISEVSEKHFGSILNLQNLNLKHELQSLALQMLIEVFFRGGLSDIMYKGNSLGTVLGKLANELLDQTNSLPNFLFGKKFFELGIRKKDREIIEDIQAVRSIIKNYVNEQKENKMYLNDNSLLSNLLTNEEILKKEGVSDSLERITNEVITVFFAGSDTTSHLLLNCFILLQQYPNCSKKLNLEIQSLKNEILTQENINKLDYLTAFIKEVFRS